MSIELYDAVNADGLFDVAGKGFAAIEALCTAAATTVPTAAETFLTQFMLRSDADDLDVFSAMEGLPDAVDSWKSSASTLGRRIATNIQQLFEEVVAEDAAQPEKSLEYSLQYIIDQMVADDDYVAGNTIGFTLNADAGNGSGDVAICYAKERGDGLVNENILAETIGITVTSLTGPTLRFRAPVTEADRLSPDWPLGSGCDKRIVAVDPTDNLVDNGDFEDETITDTPDDWIVHVGTPGTTLKITPEEQQTVTITGTPTGGSYQLLYTDPDSNVWSTTPLAYNATGATVQAALRLLPGLASVTVSSSGTSPNYVHTITFAGVRGDPAQLTSTDNLTGGTPNIAHATSVAASSGSYRGKSLEFDSNGSEVTAIYQPLTLARETVYFCHLRCKRVGAAAAGEIRVEIVDGIGGSVVDDSAGNACEHVIDATAMSTASHDSEWFAFRLPSTSTGQVYLRIRISTAVSNTASIYFDDVAIVQGTRLYAGGPYVAAFGGVIPSTLDDEWDLVVANNRNGKLQEWFNRAFGMADMDLLLPVSGSNLIPPSW